jgi:hypothetical protein
MTVVAATLEMSGTSGTCREGSEKPTPSESKLIDADAINRPHPLVAFADSALSWPELSRKIQRPETRDPGA